MDSVNQLPSSFRDPSGFLFTQDGELFRQVNECYREDYDLLMSSGLYKSLTDKNLLVAHEEVDVSRALGEKAYKVIRPERVGFISYPFEWCFSQLKDAALATLEVHKIALAHGMSLKDASSYNVQFVGCKPMFIDTLSFERYDENRPWVAYRQFCQHFVAPLALMARTDQRLSQMLRIHMDGVPLDLAAKLLGFGSLFSFSLFVHVIMHARSQQYFADKPLKKHGHSRKVSRHSMPALVDSLESCIRRLRWKPQGTEWADYYHDTNYSEEALSHKRSVVSQFIDRAGPGRVWDLGANTGVFSRIAADKDIETIAFDVDPAAVELNYLKCREEDEDCILPLVLDLTNPTPGIGWAHEERMSLRQRGPVDATMALALIHHLAISNNLPFGKIAAFFAAICRNLIIEFVPKTDSQVQRLLATREDIFDGYDQKNFEETFGQLFTIEESIPIRESARTMYLMSARRADC
jgi:hypothetical protein